MAYAASYTFDGQATGLTASLRAALRDTAGTIHATLRDVSAGFLEIGGNLYQWSSASIPAGYRGAVVFYVGSVGAGSDFGGVAVKDAAPVNAGELERAELALPDAGPGAVGGLLARGTGAGQLEPSGGTTEDTSGTTTLLARMSAARAGYLDNLNIGGAVPTAAQIATQVESQIMDDADGRAVLTAIVDKINAADPDLSGLTLSAIAAAVRDADVTTASVDTFGWAAYRGYLNAADAVTAATAAVTSADAVRAVTDALSPRLPGSGTLAVAGDLMGLADGAVTAAKVGAAALNGKGDWLPSSGYAAPLNAAGVRAAVGLGSANLDAQLSGIAADAGGRVDEEVDLTETDVLIAADDA